MSYKKNELFAISDKKLNKIYIKLQHVINGFGMEDIHSFRVEIKKLKAFLHLLKTDLKHASRLKFPKRLNKINKSLGRLRVFQLQQQNFNKTMNETGLSIPPSYLDTLSAKAAVYKLKTEELQKNIKPVKKEMADIKRHSPHKLYHTTLEKFINLKMNAIQNLLLPEVLEEKSLHLIRKHLKDIQYNIPFLKKDQAEKPDSRILTGKKIQSVAGILGDFHDIRVALSLLDEDLNELNMSEDEKILLLKIRNKWETEKENIRQRAYQDCMIFKSVKTGTARYPGDDLV
jgi:CHAD domain-containing protein